MFIDGCKARTLQMERNGMYRSSSCTQQTPVMYNILLVRKTNVT